jgi:predicted TPR repeat methyltransferase
MSDHIVATGLPSAIPSALALAITWPQGVFSAEETHKVAARVNGGVREWQECLVREAATPSQSPSP